MGDKVLCEKSDLVTIADAVRDATGITDNFNVPDLVEKTCEALAGSGGSDGIEYEIVTIPSGVNAINIPYSLQRVTGAYGGVKGLLSFKQEENGAILGVQNNSLCYIDNITY